MKTKYIISFFIIFFLILFSFNFTTSYIQNKLISLISSKKFERFVIIRIDDFLEKLSEGQLSEEQIEYYSNLLSKIEKKFKPIIENLNKKN
jgi:hypothetical protein|tara:strand:+ start:1091 stop:1363 length:273 start_codon:yes stop_codon:yes gene_type:complete